MVRRLYLILFAAVAAVAACSKNADPIESGTHEFVLEASMSMDGTVTRTAYANDVTFSWSDGDQISVLFHKGDENQFFTLTTSSVNGNTATFRGAVTDGWEIGASDTGKKWALYPAAEHSYANGIVTYYIPAETDFTASHYSANIPLAAEGDADNAFTFKPAAGAFKFTFVGIKDANKVRFTVNQIGSTHKLSGAFAMKEGGYVLYWSPKWGEIDSPANRISFVANVENETAVFYVPFAAWDKTFQPELKLTDAETDATLYSATAKAAFPECLLTRLVVTPEIPVQGAVAWKFESSFGIDWSTASASAAGRSDSPYDAIRVMKAQADASKLYLYFEVKKDALYDNSEYSYANYCHIYLGDASSTTAYSWQWEGNYTKKLSSWMMVNNAPCFKNWDDNCEKPAAVEHAGYVYYEIALARSGYAPLAGNACTVAMEIDKEYVIGDTWLGDATQIGFAPTTWGAALEVALP